MTASDIRESPDWEQQCQELLSFISKNKEKENMDKNSSVTRCKVRVNTVIDGRDQNGEKTSENVYVGAVYSDDPNSENKQWSQWTPSFNLNLVINNAGAFGKLEQGKEYFVDFIPVESGPATES